MSDEKYGARGSVLSKRTNFRVGGVMEKVNAMKKIALFLMIVGLAVAMVACQGPVGKPGSDGQDGSDGSEGSEGSEGPEGPEGPQGPPGIGVLEALGGSGHANTTVAVFINNNDDGETGDLPRTIDLSKYFRGGKGSLMYKITEKPHDESHFKVELEEGSDTVTVSLRNADADNPMPVVENDYALPELAPDANSFADNIVTTYFTVEAKDEDEFTDVTTLAVLANRKPVVANANWLLRSAAAITNTIEQRVGTQNAADASRDGGDDDERDATAQDLFSCETFNVCVLAPTVGAWDAAAELNTDFGDDLYDAKRELTYSVVEGRAAVTEVNVSGGDSITITGLKSTWVADVDPDGGADDDPGHDPVSVRIRATDVGGLFVTRDLMITVDGEPTVKEGLPTSKTVEVDDDGDAATDDGVRVIVGGVRDFFEQPETDALTITAKSSSAPIASIEGTAVVGGDGYVTVDGDLEVKAINTGSVTVTLKATDALGQSVSRMIAVTIE